MEETDLVLAEYTIKPILNLFLSICVVQGSSGIDFVDGGRMALDNKTSLLNTPLLSSSPRGAREHFSDSPFKHSRKDSSMEDSELLTDGILTLSDAVEL